MNAIGSDSRFRQITVSPDGTWTDQSAMSHWMRQWERDAVAARPAPVRVERLSAVDAFCVETEATSRERRAA